MAKKRIAADVDLCGNSVENVKNVTASGTVKAGTLEGALNASSAGKTNGKVATLPNYTYENLFGEGKYVGATGGPTYPEFYKKWLQQLVADNLLTNRTTYFCQAEPSGVVTIMLSVIDVTSLSSDGLPRICCATAINYTGDRTMFGVNSGTYYCYTSAYYGNGTATRAVLDGNGAHIANTYATKNNPDGVQAYEGNLKFGTGSVAGSVNPLDMALIPECGANRFAFLPPECITIEYSRDAGATWLDYGASDVVKTNLTSIKGGATLIIGKSTNANPADANCRLRVIFKTQSSIAKLYALFKKFAIFVSTNGSYDNVLSWCTIQARTMANVESGSDTWVTFANKVKVFGNSGWNIINTSDILTYANSKTQYGELRFIFGADGVSNSGSAGFAVRSIFAYGIEAWQTPSEMSKTGHLYSYDYAQNATFPNGVTAKSFTGNLVGRANNALMDAENNNISATYLKKTDAESTYATKTTTNGLQSQISSMVDKTQKLSSDGSTYSGKAVNDGEGNNISETYAKKAELPTASDGFYSAPKLITASSDNATGDMILSIDHPCKGTSGVEFVLMTKTKRMRCGYKETSSDKKTKDTKRGWTVAQNFRRGKMSYGENNPLPCVLDNVLDNYNTILQYVKKYYMYPFNTAITAVKTTGIPTASLYFGGWNMTTNQKTAKVFGIAARRLKSDGKYEYSQPAAILITKTATKGLRIGVL